MSMELEKEGAGVEQSVTGQLEELARLEKMTKEDFTPGPDIGGGASAPVANIDTALMCTQIIRVGFGILAMRKGDHWELIEKEAEMMGSALAAVLDKYAPDYQGGPESTLLIVALMIVGPRLAIDVQKKEKTAAEKPATDKAAA